MKWFLLAAVVFAFCYLEVTCQHVKLPKVIPDKEDHAEMKEAVEHHHHRRAKRGARVRGDRAKKGDISADMRKNAMCALYCLHEMQQETEKFIPDDKAAEKTGMVSTSQAEHFDEICEIYDDMKSCLGDCCKFPGRENVTQHFISLELMCGADRKAWNDSMPCFEKTEKSINATCMKKCGGEKIIYEQLKNMEPKEESKNNMTKLVEQLKNALDKICNFTGCHTECALPILEKECGKGPGELLKKHVGLSMLQSEEQLSMLNMFPESCAKLADYADGQELPKVHIPDAAVCDETKSTYGNGWMFWKRSDAKKE